MIMCNPSYYCKILFLMYLNLSLAVRLSMCFVLYNKPYYIMPMYTYKFDYDFTSVNPTWWCFRFSFLFLSNWSSSIHFLTWTQHRKWIHRVFVCLAALDWKRNIWQWAEWRAPLSHPRSLHHWLLRDKWTHLNGHFKEVIRWQVHLPLLWDRHRMALCWR